MSNYVKLFGSILDSTVWDTTPPIKVVWITMLAMSDRDGVVEASVPGLAKRAGVERGECERAIALFLAPDPDSRTKDFEGRRVEVIDGGWRLLNYDKYRERHSAEEAAEKNRERQQRFRDRQNKKRNGRITPVTPVTLGNDIEEGSGSGEEKAAPPPPPTPPPPGSRAGARGELRQEVREMVSTSARAGAMGGDVVAPRLVEMLAATPEAVAEPLDYARRAFDAYDALRASWAPNKRPGWDESALRRHWPTLGRILAGADPWPAPWTPEAAKPKPSGYQPPAPKQGSIIAGDG